MTLSSRAQALRVVLVLAIVSLFIAAKGTSLQAAPKPVAASATSNRVFLPLVSYTAPPTIFGTEIIRGAAAGAASRLGEAKVSWTRYNGILWSDVEPTPGARNWSSLAGVEAELAALSGENTRPIVIVRGTPSWAQRVPGAQCGPIKPEALAAFANFMQELAQRLGRPPYNVEHWEIWNEPDIDPELVEGYQVFGCWGDKDDPYYGGGYYAEMLKQVYPAIKRGNPSAQVLLGGLLLDCDPSHPPAGKDCHPARFLEGVLLNGGGSNFDIVSYHGYPQWSNTNRDWDLDFPSWSHRGGVVLGKYDYIRKVLAKYGVSKPVMLTEGGLLCMASGSGCPAAFFDAQANYVVRLYTRTWANGLLGTIWYTLNGPGWREAGLLNGDNSPRPAYNTLKFMAHTLDGASPAGRISNGSIEGYSFRKGSVTYRVYWTNNGSSVAMALPAGTTAVYNKFGQPISYTGSVGFDPIFVVGTQ